MSSRVEKYFDNSNGRGGKNPNGSQFERDKKILFALLERMIAKIKCRDFK